jgi:sugar/nucleoside kinase (ribokinase family)
MTDRASLSSPISPQGRGSSSPGPSGSPPRLGVVGTLVWDRIVERDARRVPVEEWGGISYALEAVSVSLPAPWILQPLLKVGEDMAGRATEYLRSIPRVETQHGLRSVPFPNPRVELRYLEQARRAERLEGGVPPWSWDEIQPLLDSLDALYLNFITGFEMGLETAQHLRESFPGPIYADLHSLFLGISSRGVRFPKDLPGWGAWFRAFDAVQMNEEEFSHLGRSWGDPWQLAAETVGPELKFIAVTLGDRGAAYVAAPDFIPDPAAWPATRRTLGVTGASRSGRVPSADTPSVGDPTGCGDVWGATFFGRLLSGDTLDAAMSAANRSAARNVTHRGARGLHRHLMGVLGP